VTASRKDVQIVYAHCVCVMRNVCRVSAYCCLVLEKVYICVTFVDANRKVDCDVLQLTVFIVGVDFVVWDCFLSRGVLCALLFMLSLSRSLFFDSRQPNADENTSNTLLNRNMGSVWPSP